MSWRWGGLGNVNTLLLQLATRCNHLKIPVAMHDQGFIFNRNNGDATVEQFADGVSLATQIIEELRSGNPMVRSMLE